jgi:phosphoadenosine phosphosulfate reductase
MENNSKLRELSKLVENEDSIKSLKVLCDLFPQKIIFTTSFGLEDQMITHMIFGNSLPVKVVTLDTGRLFQETYKVFSETIKRYRKEIQVYFPDNKDIEKLVTEKGPFSFYNSREERLECCQLRKVLPLNRALEGMECWISGIRAGQSDNRNQLDMIEYDDRRKLYKFYPLFNNTYEGVKRFVMENNIPYNTLHSKGYVSIGCEPCTRAVREGGDFRSGRWWWEGDGVKECGCHIN